jgi:hypothetical protein
MVHRQSQVLVGALLGVLVSATARAQPPAPTAAPEETTAGASSTSVAATATLTPKDVVYGAGARLRWVTVPHWLLGLFTKQNQSLSSYGVAGEVFRRKGDLDIMMSLSYQRMGPPDGNWLGKGHDANLDTDFIQFRNFGFVGVDAAFIWRTTISEYVAFRYGAGLGVAIMTGKMLRTSAGFCTDQNAGDTRQCRPVICPASGCTEKVLQTSEKTGTAANDAPGDPHRFADDNVPGAIPILDLVTGVDFHIPQVKGLELRLEGGFYNAFFLGMAAGYLF